MPARRSRVATVIHGVIGFGDMFDEPVLEAASARFVGLAAGTARLPIIHAAVGTLLGHLSERETKMAALMFKGASLVAQQASKEALRNRLEAKGLDRDTAEALIDVVDDTFEFVRRHTALALTAENVEAYIAQAAQIVAQRRAIDTTAIPTPPRAIAGPTGATMPPTTTHGGTGAVPAAAPATTTHPAAAPAAQGNEAMILEVMAIMGPRGQAVVEAWNKGLTDAIHSDTPDEIRGARAKLEAAKAAWQANPWAVAEMILEGLKAGHDQLAITERVAGCIEMAHVKGASREARVGDLIDRASDGSFKRWLGAAVWIGARVGASGAVVIAAVFALGVVAFGLGGLTLIVAGFAMMAWGLFAESLTLLGAGLGLGLLGLLGVGAAYAVFDNGKAIAAWAVDKLDDPFQWLGEIVKTILAGQGFTSTTTPPPASVGAGE